MKTDINKLNQKLANRAEDFAIWVLGENPSMRSGNEIRFGKKGGIRVFTNGPKAGKWRDYTDDSAYGSMINLLIHKKGCSFRDAIEDSLSFLSLSREDLRHEDDTPYTNIDNKNTAEEERKEKAAWARSIWSRSQKIINPQASSYLAGRKIGIERHKYIRTRTLKPDNFPKILKEAIEKGDAENFDQLHSVVFAATDENEIVTAIQQILVKDGIKADIPVQKPTSGALTGSAVKLAEPEDLVILAEGPETGLSIYLSTSLPVWVTLGSSNFCHAPVPDHVKTIIIAVDLEESRAGLAAALKAAGWWMRKGKEVKLAIPSHDDFNDVLCKEGPEAVRKAFHNAILPSLILQNQTILINDPDDGLAIWQATGANIIAVRNGNSLNPEGRLWNLDEPVIIINNNKKNHNNPSNTLEDQIRRMADKKSTARILNSTITFSEKSQNQILNLLEASTKLDQQNVYGIENLILDDTGKPVVIHQTRKSADNASDIWSNQIHIAMNLEQDNYDLTCIKNRKHYLMPARGVKYEEFLMQMAHILSINNFTSTQLLKVPDIIHNKDNFIKQNKPSPYYDADRAIQNGITKEDFDNCIINAQEFSL